MKIKLSELKKIIKKELNEQKQTMDLRSLQIHCKYIKSELDAVVEWYEKGNIDKTKEYINDQIKILKQILLKL